MLGLRFPPRWISFVFQPYGDNYEIGGVKPARGPDRVRIFVLQVGPSTFLGLWSSLQLGVLWRVTLVCEVPGLRRESISPSACIAATGASWMPQKDFFTDSLIWGSMV